MLYLHGFCYFAVSFVIYWQPESIKEVGVSVIFVLFVLKQFTTDLSGGF